jgi:dipeptidyl aminopeptidase/acylaminoacyl peptidase
MSLAILKQMAWVGDQKVKAPITGVILNFHGLGGGAEKTAPTTEEISWMQQGALPVFPYYGPWSWLNRQSRAYVDEIVEMVYAEYKLPASTPLINIGGSMGGGSSLLYTRYAKRPVAACLANCPVCDMMFHLNERPDLPRTIRQAFFGYEGGLDAALVEQSALQQVEKMPDIPYLIIHGGQDKAVSKAHHSDPMVARMRQRHMNVEYLELPEMGHTGPQSIEMLTRMIAFVSGALLKR